MVSNWQMTIDLYSLVTNEMVIYIYFVSFYFFSVIIILNILLAFTIDVYIMVWWWYEGLRCKEVREDEEMDNVLGEDEQSVNSDF